MFALGGWSAALLLRYRTEDGGHMEPLHRCRCSLEEDGGAAVRLISCCSGAMMGHVRSPENTTPKDWMDLFEGKHLTHDQSWDRNDFWTFCGEIPAPLNSRRVCFQRQKESLWALWDLKSITCCLYTNLRATEIHSSVNISII